MRQSDSPRLPVSLSDGPIVPPSAPLHPHLTVVHAGDHSTGLDFYDCREHQWQLSHAHGTPICTLWPRDTRTRHLTLTRPQAQRLASYLFHFHQHASLPLHRHELEWHI
jgi:hypothetical protein